MKTPPKNLIGKSVLWPQMIDPPQRFIYHLITKKRHFQQAHIQGSPSIFLALRNHAETNSVTRISMPRIGCGLDKMDWTKVKDMIQDVFHGSLVKMTVLTPPNVSKQLEAKANEPLQGTQVLENNDSNLQKAQQNDPSLRNIYQWHATDQQGTPGLPPFNLAVGKSIEEPSNSRWHTMSIFRTDQNRRSLQSANSTIRYGSRNTLLRSCLPYWRTLRCFRNY